MTSISLRTDTDQPSPMESCLNTWHDFLAGDRDALGRVRAVEVVRQLMSAALDTLQEPNG